MLTVLLPILLFASTTSPAPVVCEPTSLTQVADKALDALTLRAVKPRPSGRGYKAQTPTAQLPA